jgi:hypothetical protein
MTLELWSTNQLADAIGTLRSDGGEQDVCRCVASLPQRGVDTLTAVLDAACGRSTTLRHRQGKAQKTARGSKLWAVFRFLWEHVIERADAV